MKPIVSILSIALSLIVGPHTAQGRAKKRDTRPVMNVEYFTYQGRDDYYATVKLATQSSIFNPILPGFYSDPSICRAGNDYYLVTSTFSYYPGVPIFHSRDLVNWRQIGNVLNRPSQLPHLSGQTIGTGGIYAPQISYNPKTKLFYMITTDVGRGHFYVTTTDPHSNNWSDPVWLPEIGGIDPSFFFDDDGSAYIVHKENTDGQPKWSNHRAIRIIRFNTETGKVYGPDEKFREVGVGPEERLGRNEGPHIYKVNGKYYLICAEGGTGMFHSEVVYRADSVMGPYTRWSRNPMLTQRELKPARSNAITCTGHLDIVQTPEGKWYGVFLGMRPDGNGNESMGRETYLMPVKWSIDGYPYVTQEKDTIPLTLDIHGAVRGDNVTFGNVTFTDNFAQSSLRPEWMSLRGPVDSLCTTGIGGLRMYASATSASQKGTPSFVGHRIQNRKFETTLSLHLDLKREAFAGMLIFKTEARQYFLASDGEQIRLLRIGAKTTEELAAMPCTATALNLKAVSNGNCYEFYFREASSAEWTLLVADISTTYTASSAGGFCGTTLGPCIVKKSAFGEIKKQARLPLQH